MLSVEKYWKNLEKLGGLYTLSTDCSKYLTSQVFYMRSFYTQLTRLNSVFTQLKPVDLYLSDVFLTPSSTAPINKTTI